MAGFCFDVVASARVTVGASEGRAARAILERALDEAMAKVAHGPGDGIELDAMRLAAAPGLVTVDGLDPLLSLEEALRAYQHLHGTPAPAAVRRRGGLGLACRRGSRRHSAGGGAGRSAHSAVVHRRAARERGNP